MRAFADYRSWVFDCDGVILDSNGIKAEAFRAAVYEYGDVLAAELVAYHKRNGGLSRYHKLEYFFRSIAKIEPTPERMSRALNIFSSQARSGLTSCAIDQNVSTLAEHIRPRAKAFVISGSEQKELRETLQVRSLSHLFDGIFGSPDTKIAIIERLIAGGMITAPTVLIGDSMVDYQAAAAFGMDFIFLTHWAELEAADFFRGKPEIWVLPDLGTVATKMGLSV